MSRQHQDSAVNAAQDAVEGQIRCLRPELETRLSMEVTPAMDVWPRMVRHVGWLLERYHVKGNRKTVFEDCFREPYLGEVMKFAGAALFWLAVSLCGRVRSEIRVEQTQDLSPWHMAWQDHGI